MSNNLAVLIEELDKNKEGHHPPPSLIAGHPLLPAGAVAPDFRLETTHGKFIGLEEFRGRCVVLAFYPADWSAVCGEQMSLYNEILPEFKNLGADLLGISVDSVWCHAAFAKARNLKFPLLSDFEPKGDTARKYGIYREIDGFTERALFVIDPEGTIGWSFLSPIELNPCADGIITALEEIQSRIKLK